jgi:hypothetical protein
MSRWRERRHETTLPRHCEPPGRANARPMTGSATQSIASQRKTGLLRRCAPRNDGRRVRGGRTLPRHCERSEAIHLAAQRKNGLLRRCAPRNDEEGERRHETTLPRHCERSDAIHLATVRKNGLLRCARNDG